MDAGADFLTLTNTALGFGISIDDRRPSSQRGSRRLQRPGLKPIALRCVYEVALAMPGVPIVGCGGVMCGKDVVEYLWPGHRRWRWGQCTSQSPRREARIGRELTRELDRRGAAEVTDLVGAVDRGEPDCWSPSTCPTGEEAVTSSPSLLDPHVGGFKVGLELLMGEGPGIVQQVAAFGAPVFADAKLHDIPNTVAGAATRLGALGARWVTVHASGGEEMMRVAVEAFGEGSASGAGVLAVTVLTSLDAPALRAVGIGRPIGEQVETLAQVGSRRRSRRRRVRCPRSACGQEPGSWA